MITGEERRRRWSGEERSRILAAIDEPGAVIAEVSRREDVCTSLIYKWRREARKHGEHPQIQICARGDRRGYATGTVFVVAARTSLNRALSWCR